MSEKQDTFKTKIIPIMDKVYDELHAKKEKEYVEELKSPTNKYATLMTGQFSASVTTHVAHQNSQAHGEWNTKTTEDYISMVRSELQRQGIKVNAVTEKKMIDHLIAKNIPRSSAEYIMKKAYSETLWGLAESAADSPLDKHVRHEAEERYSPSGKDQMIAAGVSSAINYVTTAGAGGFLGQTAVDGSVMLAGMAGSGAYRESEQKRAIHEVNEALKKDVQVPRWMYEKTGVKDLSRTSYEGLKKLYAFTHKNISAYTQGIQAAIDKGERTLQVSRNAQQISVTEATIRVKQYEAFASHIKAEFVRRQANEISSRQVDVPKWMYDVNGITTLSSATWGKLQNVLNFAENNAKAYKETLEKAIATGRQHVTVKNESLTIPQLAVRAKEYETFASDIRAEMHNRSIAAKAAEEVTTTELYQSQPPSDPPVQQDQYDGWNNLLGSLGLDGMGNTFSHLGFNLAMLPDMLVGAFSGDTKSLGMNKGTMIPLAAIMIALFNRNPLIKFPLLLLGGANLFNKVSKEAMSEHQESQNILHGRPASTRYRQYPDELLDRRIKNPVLQGDKLIMDIDRTPRIITLPADIVEAYNQGALPLNAIANKVLARYDQQPQHGAGTSEGTSPALSRQYQQGQEQEQVRGIR